MFPDKEDQPGTAIQVPGNVTPNAHLFYLLTGSPEERAELIAFLKNRGIMAVFHYVPLHSSPAGRRFGRFHGEDRVTTHASERLVRLPLFHSMTDSEVDRVIDGVQAFYAQH